MKSFKENESLASDSVRAAMILFGYSEGEADAVVKLTKKLGSDEIFVSDIMDIVIAKQKCPELDLVSLATNGINDLDCFWFCDNYCELLNYQPGFDCSQGIWKCKACGHLNDISENSIIELNFKKKS